MITLAASTALVNPAVAELAPLAPTLAELALADYLSWLADGGDEQDYPGQGWSDPEFAPTSEEEAEDTGYRLGADGIMAELASPHDSDRAAFEMGHNAGDDYLWQVDPLHASHLKERAELFLLSAAA